MKKLWLATAITVFFVLLSSGIQSQTTQTKLDQPKLMMQFLGKWQANIGKDSVEVWECQLYGKAFTINVYQVVKGQKIPLYTNNISYNQEDGKFKGFTLFIDGNYGTWLGSFTSDSKFEGTDVKDFNPEPVWGRFETIVKNPNEWTWTSYNTFGVKTSELQFVGVKY